MCYHACYLCLLFECLVEEEISAMKKELDKYGIQMPAFGKIGGILASEVCNIIYYIIVIEYLSLCCADASG